MSCILYANPPSRGSLPQFLTRNLLQNVSSLSNDMNILEQFYKLNYHLLSFLGLWPYQKSRLRTVFIINILMWSFNLTQIFLLFNKIPTGNFELFVEVIPIWVTLINILVKYHTYHIGVLTIKTLMDNMIGDWKMWSTSHEENKIMMKFAETARMYTLIYSVYIYTATIVFLSMTITPLLMDVVVPLNESRPLELPAVSEYFIDEEKYFYPIYIHTFITIFISITVIVAADSQLMVFSCHVSGLFAIVGFRLEHYLKSTVTLDEMSTYQRKECLKHVKLSIKTHKRAIEFVNRIESLFSYPMLVQCGFNVICMSISLYQIVILLGKSMKVYKFISFVLGQLFHLFCANYSGQQIIEYSSRVYFQAYSGLWYETPLELRKLLVLVMRRSIEPSQLTAGKLFVFCLESFSSILQTSTSYFMVLTSVR